jgi:hypothetical protein
MILPCDRAAIEPKLRNSYFAHMLGFYVGASLGYSWNKLTVTDLDYWDGLGDFNQSNQSIIGGGQLGYNWQFRALVVGVEADFSGLGNSSHVDGDRCRVGNTCVPASSQCADQQQDRFTWHDPGTARNRGGSRAALFDRGRCVRTRPQQLR